VTLDQIFCFQISIRGGHGTAGCVCLNSSSIALFSCWEIPILFQLKTTIKKRRTISQKNEICSPMVLVFFSLYNDNVPKVDPPAPLPQSKSMHRLMTCTMFSLPHTLTRAPNKDENGQCRQPASWLDRKHENCLPLKARYSPWHRFPLIRMRKLKTKKQNNWLKRSRGDTCVGRKIGSGLRGGNWTPNDISVFCFRTPRCHHLLSLHEARSSHVSVSLFFSIPSAKKFLFASC